MPFTIGENVGSYRIVEQLGQGGMATVFKAYHPALDRYVAIKVMHPAFAGDPNFLARFQREARIVAKLDHPHIVPIYDFSQHRGHPYLVMRFVGGETLKARMERGPLSMREILRLVQAVSEALSYAHRQGVLHRDIKPSNILLTPEGDVYLTDFGLARMAEAGESTLSRDMMLGTPQYVAPEQAKGIKELDARTDVYSLGVVLYELLVGRPPFVADTPYAIIHDHIFTPLPLPSELNPDLPDAAQRVLLKALAKEPEDRFQSVEALVDALDRALESPTEAPFDAPSTETVVVPSQPIAQEAVPPSTPAPTPVPVFQPEESGDGAEEVQPRKKKRRWIRAVVGLAAVFLCAVGVVLALNLRGGSGPGPVPEENGDGTEQLLREARDAWETGDLQTAVSLYEQAIAADPSLVSAYVEGSGVLVQMGRTDEAVEALVAGIEANPDEPDLHRRAAGVALFAGRWDVAEKEIHWLMQETPGEALPHAYAGVLVLAQGGPCQEANPELEVALVIDPDHPWAHFGLGLCFLEEGQVERARAEMEFVRGQDRASEFLKKQAEFWLRRMDQEGDKRTVEMEFAKLESMASEIPDEGLRAPLKEMLKKAREAWEQGQAQRAREILEEAHGWVEANREGIGDPLAGDIAQKIKDVVNSALEVEGP